MKKFIVILSTLLLCSALLAGAAACSGDNGGKYAPGSVYSVVIVNGSGSGTYKADSECTVAADKTDGMMFDGWYTGKAVLENGAWTVKEVLVSDEETYTFRVNSDISLKAHYKQRDDLFTLTVNGGSIEGTEQTTQTLTKGSSATVTANENQTRKFLYWSVSGSEEKITQNPYTFTVEANTIVTAVYENMYLITVEGGTISGEAQIFSEGEQCTVIADESDEGATFAYWYYDDANGNEVVLSRDNPYTFVVNSTRMVKAKFSQGTEVTVTGAVIYENGATSGSFIRGERITLVADAPVGKQFTGWTLDGQPLSEESNILSLKLSAPAHTVAANFIDAEQTIQTLENTYQGFNWYIANGTSAQAAEFFRYGRPSHLFDQADYLIYYVYDSQTAGKDEWIARFFVYNTDSGYSADELVSADGNMRVEYDGGSGDACVQGADVANEFYPFMEYVIGESFDPLHNYYFAIQCTGKTVDGVVYGNSDISPIGEGAFNRDGEKITIPKA